MKSLKIITLLLLFSILVSSCMGPLTEKDNGRTIELSDDSSLEVSLDGDSGSDMEWQVIRFNKEVVKLRQREVTDNTNEDGQSYKSFLFSFDSHGSGESKIVIGYMAKDDSLTLPIKTFEVRVFFGTMGRIESD